MERLKVYDVFKGDVYMDIDIKTFKHVLLSDGKSWGYAKYIKDRPLLIFSNFIKFGADRDFSAMPYFKSWELADSEIQKLLDIGYEFLRAEKSGADILKEHDMYGRIEANRRWGIEAYLKLAPKMIPTKVLQEYYNNERGGTGERKKYDGIYVEVMRAIEQKNSDTLKYIPEKIRRPIIDKKAKVAGWDYNPIKSTTIRKAKV